MKSIHSVLTVIVLCLVFHSTQAQCNGCAFFSYPDTIICLPGNPLFTDSIATPGGGFTVNSPDLLIDPITGTLFPTGNTQPGQYTVTYTSPASCGQVCSVNIHVFQSGQSEFFYPNNVFCRGIVSSMIDPITANPLTALDTFYSTPSGLDLDPVTGTINPNNSVPGIYSITHDARTPCSNPFTLELTISQVDTGATLEYPQVVYCPTDSLAIPLLITDSAGFFSSQTGIVFADNMGTINVALSQPGFYEIRHEIVGVCPITLIDTIHILPFSDPSFSYPSSNYCSNDPHPFANPVNVGGTYILLDNAGDTLSFILPQTGELLLDSMNIASSPYTVCYTPNSNCTSTACEEVFVVDIEKPVIEVVGNEFQVNNVTLPVAWYLNGMFLNNGNAIVPVASGTYIAEVNSSGSGACTATDTIYFPVVGTPEPTLTAQQVFLMPNPGNGEVQLVVDLEHEIQYDLEVRNSLGQLILSDENLVPGQRTISLDDYASGLYLFKVNSRVGSRTVRYLKQ